MNRKLKNIIYLILFLLIFAVIFFFVNRHFNPSGDVRNEKASFYCEEPDSLDVIISGSSSALRGIMPAVLYEEQGITSYSLATVLQSPVILRESIQEALASQSPKLVIMGFEWLEEDYDYTKYESYVHTGLDPYRFSLRKLRAAAAIAARDDGQTIMDYLFPVFRYHDTWHQPGAITPLEWGLSSAKGYVGMPQSDAVVFGDAYMQTSGEAVTYAEDSVSFYRDAIEACKKAGAQVLIVKLPRTTWTMEQHEALQAFAGEMQADFLDFNTPELWETTGLDPDLDFYDRNHLCLTGAKKLTSVLGDYLKQHYDLPDAREAPGNDGRMALCQQFWEANAHCLHEVLQGTTLTYTLSSFVDVGADQYAFSLYKDGQWQTCMQSSEPTMAFEITPGAAYSASCTLLDADGNEIAMVWSTGVEIE